MLDFNRIHFYQYKDKYILLDINSDSIHEIDLLVYNYLKELKEHNDFDIAKSEIIKKGIATKEEIEEISDEINELIEEGILFSNDEEIKVFKPTAEPIIKAMCLHVAHDCNLRCPYCFADQGPYGGDRGIMSFETGKKAFEFLFKESKNRKNLNVDFFGGEPLMNFEVVKQLVKYSKERAKELGKVIEFTLTSNGLLLDKAKGDFLKQEDISVVLSLDGRKEVHDKMRYTANHKGSHDIVIKNILDFTKDGYQKYIIRGTYTRHNMDFTEDIKYLHSQGLNILSLEPVTGPAESDYTIKEADVELVKREYEKLTDYYLEAQKNNPFNFFHFNVDIYKGPCLPKRISACGAGHEYVAVSPQGDLYPCHQFVGNKTYKMGNVFEDFSHQIGKDFQKANVLEKEECKKCWARFYCSGGCHASNFYSRNDFYKVYKIGCELQKKRLECAIYINIVNNQ